MSTMFAPAERAEAALLACRLTPGNVSVGVLECAIGRLCSRPQVLKVFLIGYLEVIVSHRLRRLQFSIRTISALLAACLLTVLAAPPVQASIDTFDTPGAGSWTAPPGVTSITIECWGGGGGGGGDATPDGGGGGGGGAYGGGGGGGGAYARVNAFAVVPGVSYAYTVGAGGSGGAGTDATGGNGGTSSFATIVCVAAGGSGGANGGGSASGGNSGSVAASVGDVKYAGGRGANGLSRSGGGGGSSAGKASNGNNASTGAGASTVTGSGPGGDGTTNGEGSAPLSGPGGGGGGGEFMGSAQAGGAGYAGRIRITYKATPALSVTNSPVLYNGSPQAVTLAATVGAAPVPGTFSNVLYNGSPSAPTDAGTYAVTADFTPDKTTNYHTLTGVLAGNFVIQNVSTPVLSVTNSPVVYNGAPQAAMVESSAPGMVGNVLYNGSPTVPTDAGTYVITADFMPANAANYVTLTNAPAGSFVIQKAATTTTVTCMGAPFTYTGLPLTPCSASVTGPGLDQPLTVSYADNINAGTATANASYEGSANYLASSDTEVFVIDEATPPTIWFYIPYLSK